jgi:hypothetical protein
MRLRDGGGIFGESEDAKQIVAFCMWLRQDGRRVRAL